MAIAVAYWAVVQLQRGERETRMLEYYLLELDGRVIAAGIKKPEDGIANKLNEERRK